MIDLEDIFKAILAYLRHEVGVDGLGDPVTRLNFYINKKNEQKGDTLLEFIKDEDQRYVLNQRKREQGVLDQWIDIAVDDDVVINSNFDAAAKTYAISLSHLIQDDFKDSIFYKSCRMADVLQDIMGDFFKTSSDFGFMVGAVDRNGLPLRVSIKGTKALMSGVTYVATIH